MFENNQNFYKFGDIYINNNKQKNEKQKTRHRSFPSRRRSQEPEEITTANGGINGGRR